MHARPRRAYRHKVREEPPSALDTPGEPGSFTNWRVKRGHTNCGVNSGNLISRRHAPELRMLRGDIVLRAATGMMFPIFDFCIRSRICHIGSLTIHLRVRPLPHAPPRMRQPDLLPLEALVLPPSVLVNVDACLQECYWKFLPINDETARKLDASFSGDSQMNSA